MTEEKEKKTEKTEKRFWHSKKSIAFFFVWVATVGLISAAMLTRQPSDVLRELISSLGLALMTCSTAAVSGQSWLDATTAKK